jgi:hypothetical protein
VTNITTIPFPPLSTYTPPVLCTTTEVKMARGVVPIGALFSLLVEERRGNDCTVMVAGKNMPYRLLWQGPLICVTLTKRYIALYSGLDVITQNSARRARSKL